MYFSLSTPYLWGQYSLGDKGEGMGLRWGW